jgi:hypothetical protein
MAGNGPAPKDSPDRRRTNKPARGDWIEISAPKKPLLPTLAQIERGTWAPRTKATWEAWRKDPATTMWTSADVAFAIETIYLLEELVTEGPASLAGEIRLRQDTLGLTAKGKQDRRWRVADAAPATTSGKLDDEVAARRARREQQLASNG